MRVREIATITGSEIKKIISAHCVSNEVICGSCIFPLSFLLLLFRSRGVKVDYPPCEYEEEKICGEFDWSARAERVDLIRPSRVFISKLISFNGSLAPHTWFNANWVLPCQLINLHTLPYCVVNLKCLLNLWTLNRSYVCGAVNIF